MKKKTKKTKKKKKKKKKKKNVVCVRALEVYVVTHSFIHSFEERESAMRRRKSL